MKLPNLEHAVVPAKKVAQYLLSSSHPRGQHKAAFFIGFGFTPDAWTVLAGALKKHASENEVSIVEETLFGIRYTIDGQRPNVRVGWFIRNGETAPVLATAFPLPRTRR